MTKKQFRKNYRTLVRNVSANLLRYGEAALKSGAFELSEEAADWGLPKNVLVAGLESQIWEYRPHSERGRDRKQIRNIISCTPRA